jgi:hypothetical protein
VFNLDSNKRMELDLDKAKQKRAGDKGGRKRSVILAIMGLDPIENAKKAAFNKKRAPQKAGGGAGYLDSNKNKFERGKALVEAAQKVNATVYKSLNTNGNGNAQRPKSASEKKFRGAPVSVTRDN